MTYRDKDRRRKILSIATLLLVLFLIVFFGLQFFTKTGIFKVPGVVIYDESVSQEEIIKLNSIFNDEIVLEKDVAVSAYDSFSIKDLAKNGFISEIYVPVADYYESRSDVSEFEESEYKYIPIDELDFKQKLLSINNKYYLDELTEGAKFRVISFESELFDEEILPLISDLYTDKNISSDEILTFAQTGVTALSRGVNRKLGQVGDATFFANKIGDYLSKFDITHTSNEASFSDYATSENICAKPEFVNTLKAIGLDVVELTGNHNLDCGDESALSTIDIYAENNIQIVGGGKTAEDAAKPLKISQKETNITFLAYNLSTGGATYDSTPGANQYYEENATAEIAVAKERGDFVLVDVQYYECSAYVSEYEDPTCDYANSSAGDQVGFFRHLIDLGADVVVGTSAHQPQTFELYGDGAIYYGLGNLFFDQAWWPGTTRSLILAHYFKDGKLLQTKLMPTSYDFDYQPSLLDEESREWFIKRLTNARP